MASLNDKEVGPTTATLYTTSSLNLGAFIEMKLPGDVHDDITVVIVVEIVILNVVWVDSEGPTEPQDIPVRQGRLFVEEIHTTAVSIIADDSHFPTAAKGGTVSDEASVPNRGWILKYVVATREAYTDGDADQKDGDGQNATPETHTGANVLLALGLAKVGTFVVSVHRGHSLRRTWGRRCARKRLTRKLGYFLVDNVRAAKCHRKRYLGRGDSGRQPWFASFCA